MNKLINVLIEDKNIPILFTFDMFAKKGYEKDTFEKDLFEGIKEGYIDRVYNDIYTLNVKYHKRIIPTKVLSQMIIPNSYVSMYYVLYNYNWIPETIFSVTSVSVKEKCTIDTNGYGTFVYLPLYKKLSTAGIYIEKDYEGTYRTAKPLRALCDLLYFKDKEWQWSLDNLYEVFRIFKDSLEEDLTSEDFNELQGTFGVKNIEIFLERTRKELQL